MKSCLTGKAKEIYPETVFLFKTITLSVKTVLEALKTTGAVPINHQLKNKTNEGSLGGSAG